MSKIFLSGFTIMRNILKYDYPVMESLTSILPLVDEMIIGLGNSDDGTEKIIDAIPKEFAPKIKTVNFHWDERLIEGGEVLSHATNHALSKTSGDWCFYLQADEVIHEVEYGAIRSSINRAEARNKTAISFRYHHFKGDYQSINPWAYKREIRMIKNHLGIRSVGDACTFHEANKNTQPLTYHSNNHIYHYGWVKPPEKMIEKTTYFESLYHGKEGAELRMKNTTRDTIFDEVKICRIFKGSHPAVMQKRIAEFPALKRMKSRWLYYELYKKLFKYGWV